MRRVEAARGFWGQAALPLSHLGLLGNRRQVRAHQRPEVLDPMPGGDVIVKMSAGGSGRSLPLSFEGPSGTPLARHTEAPGAMPGLTCINAGGRYWDRTSDLLGVNEALSR